MTTGELAPLARQVARQAAKVNLPACRAPLRERQAAGQVCHGESAWLNLPLADEVTAGGGSWMGEVP